MKHPAETPHLSVIARAPFTVYYEGPAQTVSATNKVGAFDILPGHADFFSILLPGEIVIETDTEPVRFTVSSGIITVRDDAVMLFVDM
jgi:F0F1-type ATP synthase epsilon subunit